MEDIRLFLGSSIVELKDERNRISALVQGVNDILISTGIYDLIDLFLCEYQPASIGRKGSQEEINDALRASHIACFMVHQKFGEYSREEFDIAYDQFRKKGMPKTIVFVKELKNGEQINKEAKDFLESLRQKGIEPENFSEYRQLKMAILKVIDRYFIELSIAEKNEHLYVRGKKLTL